MWETGAICILIPWIGLAITVGRVLQDRKDNAVVTTVCTVLGLFLAPITHGLYAGWVLLLWFIVFSNVFAYFAEFIPGS